MFVQKNISRKNIRNQQESSILTEGLKGNPKDQNIAMSILVSLSGVGVIDALVDLYTYGLQILQTRTYTSECQSYVTSRNISTTYSIAYRIQIYFHNRKALQYI